MPGPQGTDGTQGSTGSTGSQGPQGATGPQGTTGSAGAFDISLAAFKQLVAESIDFADFQSRVAALS